MRRPTNQKPVDRPNRDQRIHRPVVALGRQLADGTITVTDVLCFEFPDTTDNEIAELSQKLTNWARQFPS